MFVRIARFEGGDPSGVDESIARVRAMMEEGSTPPGLEGARRSMMLVDRKSGRGLGVTFFDTEEDLRAGDQAMNAMARPEGATGERTSVELYEVAIDRGWRQQPAGAEPEFPVTMSAGRCSASDLAEKRLGGPILPGPPNRALASLTCPSAGLSGAMHRTA